MSKKTVAIVAVLVLLLVGASVFGVLAWKSKEKAEEMAPASVSFVVNAEGWSQETSSPVPIQVIGETADKEKVDVKYFLGASDEDLSLKPGTYNVEVYASPVNVDGGMYRCPKASKITVPKNTGEKQNVSKPEKTGEAEAQSSASASADSGSVVSAEFELSPIPANEITDEDIEKAQAAMKDAGLDEAKIKTFTDSARNARQTELDRLEKERKVEEERKESERKAEEMRTKARALAGSYTGFQGSDGSGLLNVLADGNAVYEFYEEGDERTNRLTFTSITSVYGGYQVTFAEDFAYGYSPSVWENAKLSPAGTPFLICTTVTPEATLYGIGAFRTLAEGPCP